MKHESNGPVISLVASGSIIVVLMLAGIIWSGLKAAPVNDASCDPIEARQDLAIELRRLADVQEQCGHLAEIHDLNICSYLVPPAAFDKIDTCHDVQERAKAVRMSLQAFARNVHKYCEEVESCQQLLSRQAQN